jgi:hypothetical protein
MFKAVFWIAGAAAAGSVIAGVLVFAAVMVYLALRHELEGMGPIGAFWAGRMFGGPGGAVLGGLYACFNREPPPLAGWVLVVVGGLMALLFYGIFAVNVGGWIASVRDNPELYTWKDVPFWGMCEQDLPPALIGTLSIIGGVTVLRGGA